MARGISKSVSISLPSEMLEELDRVREREHRTRSEILREALRFYVAAGGERRIPLADPEPGELEALARGRAQTARGEYVLLEDLIHDLDADGRKGRGKKSPRHPG